MKHWNLDQSWTLFLDRDGVINERIMDDYVKLPEEFILLPGVSKAISKANQLFSSVFVVTNQQGIGKGLMTERNLLTIHDYCSELLKVDNARIDRYYFAPNLASENSLLRKPNSGMALLAKEEFPTVDFNKSIMVGDSDSDIEFGKKLGMKTVFINHQDLEAHKTADLTFDSLELFIKFIEL
ncbi:D-glycero-alpha-D-manno-heptose-1,7-bisphosphate 7-phosphatase [Fluviicola taffensis]|uniref:D,D-heptose 1,7-bisphosphate phosphatase n=1 Tax=Fluviicola taffensis (strain DSM 16823 / NCIMB 13979 / RW262) TaxID=755732 RepID=F2IIN9_FLUTR|nr:HAD-IIIA family hydrolase [Fluviicola taffensis]AEA46001.1 histidinol-phosphate phosphatase family protein [Fluviicola taffensis DSM 16823]